jgi:hypothetical protein
MVFDTAQLLSTETERDMVKAVEMLLVPENSVLTDALISHLKVDRPIMLTEKLIEDVKKLLLTGI